MKRVVLIVMDGCGVGALPDALGYGATDPDSNTLLHVIRRCAPRIPNLTRLGLTRVLGLDPTYQPIGAWGRCGELSKGKDSVTGHWEMMGIVTKSPFPTYPNGFPPDVIDVFERRIGRKTIGNRAASGTVIIQELGAEHLATGKPIVYTSADSVFQVAAHEDVFSVDDLYEMCRIAREMLIAPNDVERVIARPFTGDACVGFTRSANRKDFPLTPPPENTLSALNRSGKRVHGIGVVVELFPARYFAVAQRTQSNPNHLAAIKSAIRTSDADFIFANCEDFDMLYGHRNDVLGFARCLEEFDYGLGEIIEMLGPDDVLILTADHGNDPSTIDSTDHSREYTPLLVYGHSDAAGADLGTRATLADLGATVASVLGAPWSGPGTSFL